MQKDCAEGLYAETLLKDYVEDFAEGVWLCRRILLKDYMLRDCTKGPC